MTRAPKEFLVGIFVLLAVVILVGFGWLIGVVGGWGGAARYHVLYGFAGGVEVGSPVRVSGVKVGKVEKIEFLSEPRVQDGEPITLKVTVSVADRAVRSVRRDSKFYVNMAGIIGERYIEISPGTAASEGIANGAEVRGVDPPRIDQLLSQGYGVFGKILDFLNKNEKPMSEMLANFEKLLEDMNKLLKSGERKKLVLLLDNMNALSSDLRAMTGKLNEPKARDFFEQLRQIVERAHGIDKEVLEDFLQKKGIRARIF